MKFRLFILLLFLSVRGFAQGFEIFRNDGYTLVFTNNDPALDKTLKSKLITTFFKVYPLLAKEYNRKTAKQVYMLVDTAYKGVAATDNAHVRISAAWFHKHPEDIDVVTHEVMHIVQDYKESVGPGWLTEGIADYARYKFGVNNAAANWSLPPYAAGQNYTDSYRRTARFLAWIEMHEKKNIVKKLDKSLRDHTYTADTWKDITGKSLDDLWKEYVADPGL
ncbi:basic secretory protein-like protein [Mucilaginibacter ginkgonis]|uniref:Secretory protein n=1 Tax=Mucilaginibacter ginkgonis TaxID=2682091 RepID=A0A6I4INI5_9SPHI|nr:basic secretory protein-like protein [Mucilaginibacter ginkgonis]QQL48661.1 secretory protein [Mucilaginibacter ginkgonis]